MAKQPPRQQIVLDVKPAKKNKPRGNPEAIRKFQFKPGQSGNPSGKSRGNNSKVISAAYTAALNQQVPDEVREKLGLEGEVTWADAIGLQMVRKAIEMKDAKINFTAVTELREVTEGKVPEKQEIAGAGGTPLQAPSFSVNFVKPNPEDTKASDK